MSAEELAEWFPNLLIEGYDRTSPETSIYNCIAWAMGEDFVWWEPKDPDRVIPHKGPTFWPAEAPNELTL